MNGLSPFLIVIPLAVLVACVAFSVLIVRESARATGEPSAWRQAFMLIIASFLFMNLGVLLMSSESSMPAIVLGAAPCAFFLVVGSAWPRVLAAVLLSAWIAWGAVDYRETRLRGERMKARFEEKQRAFMKEQADREETPEPTRQPEPGVGADSR